MPDSREQAARAEAEKEHAQAEARRLFQTNVYNTSLLANANPAKGERKDITVRELLDVASRELDNGAQQGQPRIEAALCATLGMTYRSLSMWDAAETQWQKSLDLETAAAGPDTPEAAYAMTGLGQVKLDKSEIDAASKLLKQALAIEREQLPGDDPRLADTLNNLGVLSDARGEYQAAQGFYREAMQVYQEHPENTDRIADATANLATSAYRLGDNKQAVELANKALAMRRQRFGEQHIDVWNSLVSLATYEEAQDDLAARRRRVASRSRLSSNSWTKRT